MRYEIDFQYTIQWKAEWKCIQIQLQSTFGCLGMEDTFVCIQLFAESKMSRQKGY